MRHDNQPRLSVLGVGPGDPELLTLKARRLLAEADVIFAPCAAVKKSSLALEIIRGAFGEDELTARVVEQVYPMTRDARELVRFWDKAADEVGEVMEDESLRAVFITLGDPSLYSTWSYLKPRLDEKRIGYKVIPGVPSFFLGAALTGRELAIGEEKLAVIPMPENTGELMELMGRFHTLVLMKIGRAMGRLKGMLEETGYLDKAWIVSCCGLPEEAVKPFSSLTDEELAGKIGYLSHVIITKEEENQG